jgi:hypothetical protein
MMASEGSSPIKSFESVEDAARRVSWALVVKLSLDDK